MYLVGLLVLSQVADGLTYTLARNGHELNPVMAHLGADVLLVKFAAALVVGLLAWRLRGHPRALLWMGVVGWVGALSNFTGYG
jgi:hypothetical protein